MAKRCSGARMVLVKRLVRRSATYVELHQFTPDLTFRIPRDSVLVVLDDNDHVAGFAEFTFRRSGGLKRLLQRKSGFDAYVRNYDPAAEYRLVAVRPDATRLPLVVVHGLPVSVLNLAAAWSRIASIAPRASCKLWQMRCVSSNSFW